MCVCVSLYYSNICRYCKCLANTHNLSHSNLADIYSRVGLEPPQKADHDKASKLGYSWVPSGLSAKQVRLLDMLTLLDEFWLATMSEY